MDEIRFYFFAAVFLMLAAGLAFQWDRKRVQTKNAGRDARADAHLRAGRQAQALGLLEKSHADTARLLGSDHPETRRTKARLEEVREQCPAARGARDREEAVIATPPVALRASSAPDATEALKEMFYPSNDWRARLKGRTILASDGLLHTFWEREANWYLIWMLVSASEPGQGMHPFAAKPYWTSGGPDGADAPLSVLAFCDRDTRLRIASDPATPPGVLGLLSQDWNENVSTAAARPR